MFVKCLFKTTVVSETGKLSEPVFVTIYSEGPST